MKNNKFNHILTFDLSNVQNMLNAIGRNVDNLSLYCWKMKNSVAYLAKVIFVNMHSDAMRQA